MVALKVALRFLTSSRAQTVLIVLGIAIGVSVQVFVGTLVGSLQASLVDNTIGNSSQVTILPADAERTIENWEEIITQLSENPDLTEISVSADSSAFALWNNRTYPVLLRGMELGMAEGIYGLSKALYDGSLPLLEGQVLMGKDLSNQLGAGIGDVVVLSVPAGGVREVTVSGFFDLRVATVNERWLISNLGTSQETFGFGGGVTSIEMQVRDVFKADAVALAISDLPALAGLTVQDWKGQNEQLLSGLQAQSVSSYMIQVFVLAAVVIAIAAILAIKVVQKSRDIGILKAMGISDRDSSLIFLYQGSLLGLGGASLGVVVGLALITAFSTFVTGAGGDPIISLTIDAGFVVASGIIAVLAAVLASVIPARKSSKLSPIEVIRGE